MVQYDVVVVGGGILGCFAARNLRCWHIRTLLIEQQADICAGMTRANSAIVYAGYDNRPGSLKAEMTVRANAGMQALCAQLEVAFSRCGSLLVSYDEAADKKLQKKLQDGLQNGVPGLTLLSGAQAQRLEPMLRAGVSSALYAPSTGTVNPWRLGIAAFENALQNGAEAMLETALLGISAAPSGYRLQTSRGEIACRMVLNCAGAAADQVQELLFPPSVRLRLDGADYLVLDPHAEKPQHVIFHEAQGGEKGITAIPCVEGNLLLAGGRRALTAPYATTQAGLFALRAGAQALFPALDLQQTIRSFGAVRPNPYLESGKSLHDFCITHPAPGFYSLIGIKTPGLTCANELGQYLAQRAAEYLGAPENPAFDPHRPAITAQDSTVVCQCEQITQAEILEAIRRGARTVGGVKRRVGAGMGRCQGSRCTWEIEKLLEASGHGAL